jgi:hypothetical protein
MTEGITCYERDEVLCEDQMCLRVGCRLRNERLGESPSRNVAPTKVQCADCHWLGLSSGLEISVRRGLTDSTLVCPICRAPFGRYPQRPEHHWSDPY